MTLTTACREEGMMEPKSCDRISAKCDKIKRMLLEKNAAYGDSALSPMQVFGTGKPTDLIRARIDDKLSRIKNCSDAFSEEDAILDLTGYLILLMIANDEEVRP
jgi:hypothetical protein